MKAAVLEDLGKIVVKEVETPEVTDDTLVVRVRSCAVCGSDLRIYRHGNPRVKPPQIVGHEIAGDVVEVSPPFDPSGTTGLNGVQMMFEIMCLMAENIAGS